jgi:ribosomal protein L11 methyltransferase
LKNKKRPLAERPSTGRPSTERSSTVRSRTGKWLEITAKGPRESFYEVSEILIKAGSPGVLDLSIGPSAERAFTVLKAYLRFNEAGKAGALKDGLKGLGWTITSSPYIEEDWTSKWKSFIRPVRVGGVFVVKPTWRKVKAAGRVVVEIDPGMAFGTGTHPTTKMCLKAMAGLFHKRGPGRKAAGCNLLDVGTGTGILAIAAKKLGVKKVVGADIDPVALEVAKKSARLNNVNITLTRKPAGEIKGRFSIVVSNILSTEPVRLAPALVKKADTGGFVILSGILKEEAPDVMTVYRGLGLEPFKTYREGEWLCPVFERVI